MTQEVASALYAALVEAKKEMWMMARHDWNLSDFNNWAVIQQINRSADAIRWEVSMTDMANATSFCGNCHTIDGCVCPVPTKAKRIFRTRPREERYNIIAFLRQGGEYVNGVWHAWDGEMAQYALGFAIMIEAGRHRK